MIVHRHIYDRDATTLRLLILPIAVNFEKIMKHLPILSAQTTIANTVWFCADTAWIKTEKFTLLGSCETISVCSEVYEQNYIQLFVQIDGKAKYRFMLFRSKEDRDKDMVIDIYEPMSKIMPEQLIPIFRDLAVELQLAQGE